MEAAEFQNEKGAKRSFHYAIEAEKIHAELFKQAQDAAKQGKDFEFEAVYICRSVVIQYLTKLPISAQYVTLRKNCIKSSE
jgi:rubrerythrin